MGAARAASVRRRPVAALILFFFAEQTSAESVSFDEVLVPPGKSLQPLYLFYVHSQNDSLNDRRGPPAVKFNLGLRKIHENIPGSTAGHQGLEAILLPYKELLTLVETSHACGFEGSAEGAAGGVVRHEITSSHLQEEVNLLVDSGIYALLFANCGKDTSNFKVTGTVSMRNSHGFLSAIDYPKKNFYCLFAVLYSVSAMMWVHRALQWQAQGPYIFKGIALISIVGVAECTSWWLLYYRWNTSNEYSDSLFLIAALFTVCKVMLSFRLVLISTMSIEHLQLKDKGDRRGDYLKVDAVLLLYMVCTVREMSVLAFRHSRAVQLEFVMMNVAPSVAVACALFAWCHQALAGVIAPLAIKRHDAQVAVFVRSQAILNVAMLGGFVVTMLQVFDPTAGENVQYWWLHWFCSDGAFQLVSFASLCAAMHTWLPHARQGTNNSQVPRGAEKVIGAPSAVCWDFE